MTRLDPIAVRDGLPAAIASDASGVLPWHTAIIVEGTVDPLIVRDVRMGIAELAQVVDLGAIYLSEDPTVQTAQTELVTGGLNMRVNPTYFASVTDLNPTWLPGDPIAPGKDAPDYMGMHETLHEWFNPGNPAFAALTTTVRVGSTNTFDLYFNGPEAVAVNGGPVPIDQWGHILGGHQGDIMSGEWPTYRDRPQELSNVDLAILRDVGALAPVSDATSNHLAALYAATLGRAADAGGLAYWQHQLDAGMPLAAIASSFFAQPEAQALYANKPTEALVEAVYHNTLGRAPDSAGEAYWSKALSTGAVDPGQFVLAIINGAQGTDAAHLQHAVDEYVISTVGIVS